MSWFPPLFMGLAVSLLFGVIVVMRVQQPEAQSDAWRDRPPFIFRLIRPFVNLFAYRIASSVSAPKREAIQARLTAAGLHYEVRPEEFIATRRVGLGAGALLAIYVLFNLDLDIFYGGLLVLILALIGYAYPDIWLRDLTTRRSSRMEKQFPFFLDLVVLAMRAGLNFSSAVSHAVGRLPDGPVRSEFARLLRDIRTGISRREALTNLAQRINIISVSNFAAVINQAEETGGELSKILLDQATQRRSERFIKAEKLANQAPVKMLLPLVGFLFPITLIVIAFPMYIKARDTGALDFLFQ